MFRTVRVASVSEPALRFVRIAVGFRATGWWFAIVVSSPRLALVFAVLALLETRIIARTRFWWPKYRVAISMVGRVELGRLHIVFVKVAGVAAELVKRSRGLKTTCRIQAPPTVATEGILVWACFRTPVGQPYALAASLCVHLGGGVCVCVCVCVCRGG